METKLGAISFVDIVLNHTAIDSEWLNDCPGAVYNEKTVPILASAILLDIKLAELNDKFVE